MLIVVVRRAIGTLLQATFVPVHIRSSLPFRGETLSG